MSRKKIMITLVLLLLLTICSIYLIKFKNSNLTVIKTFLKQYYTVDEIMASEMYINEEFILQKKVQYKNLIEASYIDTFVNSRLMFRNLQYAEDNNCTLSIDKIKIELLDKLSNKTVSYKFNATIIAVYENTTSKAQISGKIQVISIGGKSYINYLDIPNIYTIFK